MLGMRRRMLATPLGRAGVAASLAWVSEAASNGSFSRESEPARPLLFLDVDGVISLFDFPQARPAPGQFHLVDGIGHCIGADCAPRLERLLGHFDAVWATGWEEKANEYLPRLLGLPQLDLPVLTFDGRAVFGSAHWKVDAIHEHAGERPAAWIDDNIDEECRQWARERRAPTLLVATKSAEGLLDEHVDRLIAWSEEVRAGADHR
jgi:hypothetical protein